MRSSGDTPLTPKLVIKTHNEKAVDDDQKEADDVSTNTQIAPHFPSVGNYSSIVPSLGVHVYLTQSPTPRAPRGVHAKRM